MAANAACLWYLPITLPQQENASRYWWLSGITASPYPRLSESREKPLPFLSTSEPALKVLPSVVWNFFTEQLPRVKDHMHFGMPVVNLPLPPVKCGKTLL